MLALTTSALPASAAVRPAAGAVAPCRAGVGVGLVSGSVDRSGRRGQDYITDHVRPGSTLTRQIQICNGTARTVTLTLHVGSAAVHDGGFQVLPRTSRNGELASWTTLSPAALVVPAGQRVLATATFRIPAQAEAGERFGALLVALPPSNASGFAMINQVGVRIYLSVGEGGAPRSDFTVEALQAVRRPDGTPEVLARVRNTGARTVDITGTGQLAQGPGGLAAGPFTADQAVTLKKGESAALRVPLDKAIVGGPWRVLLDLHCFDLNGQALHRSAQADLSFPAAAGANGPPVAAGALPQLPDRGLLVPIAGGLIALLLLLLALLVRRRDRVAS